MPSEHKVGQYLEWCTDIPIRGESRDSPIFFLKGNEWFFRLSVVQLGYAWYFRVYLELKKKLKDFEPCRIFCKIGFKQEGFLNLCRAEFELSEHHEVWTIRSEELQEKLPPNYMAGNLMKFVFFFDDVSKPLLERSKKTDDKSIQTPPYLDARFLLERTSTDFVKLLDEGTNHDVEFICGDQTIKAHKNILCCRSNVFSSMFQGDMIEGQMERVEIEDKDATFFPQFLRCLYTGLLLELTVDTAVQLYIESDKYGADTLKQQCAEFLVDNLSLENACEILILADGVNDLDLKKGVMEYMCKEKVPVMGEKWTDFCCKNQKLANEVLNLFCRHLCQK